MEPLRPDNMNQTGSTSQSNVITPKKMDRRDVTLAHAIIPFNSLTETEKRFVVAYAGGATAADAYRFAKPEARHDLASRYGSRLLSKQEVQYCVQELSAYKNKKYDFTKDKMAHRLMLLFGDIKSGPINSKDRAVLLDIYKEINKMYGNYDHHENQITVNHNPLQIIIEQENTIDIPFEEPKINPALDVQIDGTEGE